MFEIFLRNQIAKILKYFRVIAKIFLNRIQGDSKMADFVHCARLVKHSATTSLIVCICKVILLFLVSLEKATWLYMKKDTFVGSKGKKLLIHSQLECRFWCRTNHIFKKKTSSLNAQARQDLNFDKWAIKHLHYDKSFCSMSNNKRELTINIK